MRWMLLAIVACSKPPPPAPPAPIPTDAAIVRATDAAIVTRVAVDAGPLGCIVDTSDKQACDARGSLFYYGPPPIIWCSGTRTPDDFYAKAEALARTKPCPCNDQVSIDRERANCARRP